MVGWFARVPVLLLLVVMVTGGSLVMNSGPAQAVTVMTASVPQQVPTDCRQAPGDGGGSSGFGSRDYCEALRIQEYELAPEPAIGIAPGPGGLGKGILRVLGRGAGTGGEAAKGTSAGVTSWLGAAGIAGFTAYTVDTASQDLVDRIMTAPEFWSNLFQFKCAGSAFICPADQDGNPMPWTDWLTWWETHNPGEAQPLAHAGSLVEYQSITVDMDTNAVIDYQTTCTTQNPHNREGLGYPQWCISHISNGYPNTFDPVLGKSNGARGNVLCQNVSDEPYAYTTTETYAPGETWWVSNRAMRTGSVLCGGPESTRWQTDPIIVQMSTVGGCHVPTATELISHYCIAPTVHELGDGLSAGNLADLIQLDIETECRDAATGTLAVGLAVGGVGDRSMPRAVCEPGEVMEGIRIQGQMFGEAIGELASIDWDGLSPNVRQALNDGEILRVQLNGRDCFYGLEGCATWWSNPDARCLLGDITLSRARCEILRYAYVTPWGATTDPANPYDPPVPIMGPGPVPAPWPPETPLPIEQPIEWPPGYMPEPPPEVPEVPLSCPATGHPLEQGLNEGALNIWRCTVLEYPGFNLTSGLRANGPDWSDHTHGDAVDIEPFPSWDTQAGNAAGWDAAYWLTANATELGVKYVIFDHWRWPSYDGRDTWVPYQHPSGLSGPSYDHENHLHVSAGSPINDPRDDYGDDPTPRPDPVPGPGPSPGPGPGPGPGPSPSDPVLPISGDNPDPGDGTNCLADGWTWNPVSWVYTPVKCSLLWAFVPPEDSDPFGGVTEALEGTPLGEWVAAPGQVLGALSTAAGGPGAGSFNSVLEANGSAASMMQAETNAVGDCMGPGLTVTAFGDQHTLHPLAACSGPMQVISTIVRNGLMLGLYIGGFVVVLNQLAGAFGFSNRLGGGGPEVSA